MQVFFEQHASLSSRPTLFLHGNLASHRWWHPTVAAWKGKGPHPLILSDWRGCGRNEEWSADRPFSLRDLAEDQLQLLEQLDHTHEVHLVGHSLGGLIALQMMILQPERFSRALLLDPVGARGVVFDDSMYEAFRQMAQSPELTRTVILSTILGSENLPSTFRDDIALDAHKAVRGIGRSVLEILKTVNLTDQIRKLKAPTLIIYGEKDQIIPKNDVKQLCEWMPNAQLEILPNQGHCWNVEDSPAFAARAERWFSNKEPL